MRTKNSLKNMSISVINGLLLNILRFISRTFFIRYLDSAYLGVNGLLSNVLGILSLADLGLSTAIGFALYKPLAENDKEKINSLMYFFKKSYRIIAIVVFALGIGLLPFLKFFVDDINTVPHLRIYYLVFLFNMSIGYLFAYLRTLIIADQKEYKITKIIIFFNIVLTILQILVLILFQNYFIYLLTQSLVLLIENIVVNKYINKNYAFLSNENVQRLNNKDKKLLTKNIKALMFHKVGSYFVDSTDNLIISRYLGLVKVGLYSNYYLITSTFNSFLTTALWSTIASFGNLNVCESEEKRFEIYNSVNLLGFTAHAVIAICLYHLLNLFIGCIWLDSSYLLSNSTILIICINFYISGMMHINDAIKSSGGLYDNDKYVPLIQSAINIVFSVIFVKRFGISGVFIGTLISSIVPTIVKPIILYKYLFKKSAFLYFKDYFFKLIVVIISVILTGLINNKIIFNNPYILFITKGFVSTIVTLIIIFIFYFKSAEFKTLKEKVYSILKRGN